jgi:hypothetical protein
MKSIIAQMPHAKKAAMAMSKKDDGKKNDKKALAKTGIKHSPFKGGFKVKGKA